MKLIIFRHGRTTTNGIIAQGAIGNSELNELGIKQAEELADKLKRDKIKTIFASPLLRAQQTAQIVAKPNNSEIVTLNNLIEVNIGIADGISHKEFDEKYETSFGPKSDSTSPDYMSSKIPGGESRAEALVRWLEVEKYITYNFTKGEKEKTVAIATHGDLMGVIYYHYYGIPDYVFDNCEYFEIHLEYKNTSNI